MSKSSYTNVRYVEYNNIDPHKMWANKYVCMLVCVRDKRGLTISCVVCTRDRKFKTMDTKSSPKSFVSQVE